MKEYVVKLKQVFFEELNPLPMDEYSTRLAGNPFLFFEMRTVADLMIQDINREEINQRVRENNLFQYRTPKSIRKRLNAVFVRIDVLDEPLLTILACGEAQSAKLVALYSILKTDRLFYEFCLEVLREKYLSHQERIEVSDFKSFFTYKEEQNPVVASWHENTLVKLRQVYTRILLESGLLKDDKKRFINPPVMDAGLKKHLHQIGDKSFVLAMLGG